MLPYITLFNINISMYALCIYIGIIIGVFIAFKRGEIYSFDRQHILFAFIYGVLGTVIGGKILYFITLFPLFIQNHKWFLEDKSHIVMLFTGGFVYYGGLFGAVLGVFLYAKQYKLKAKTIIDIIVLALPIIHAFGRLGCFFAGCCYGRPTKSPFGVIFHHSLVAPTNIKLFPVQLLEAIFNIMIFIIMYCLLYKKKTNGEALLSYLFSYSVVRFLLEFLRYDSDRGSFLFLSTSQWISIVIFLWVIFQIRKKKSC